MSVLRKLEIACGVATAMLGMAAAAQMLHMNIETMRRLERSFSVFQELLGASILYILPGLLVALGSYLHASRLRLWGLPMLLISSLLLTIMFVLLVLNLAFYTPNTLFWLNLLFSALAIVTVIVALLVHFRERS